MKTHGHYETLSAIKQQTEIVEILVERREVKSPKLKRMIIRDMKRNYRLSKPKKTRCIAEVQNGKDVS